ncbi:YPDG domain-containing protein, partial [Corynebacterium coyleae]|uniref:YPDG domain-containing protein n=1 Tax=Corynebacterium coyleae TaxID=53374 RepID=UPI00254F1886
MKKNYIARRRGTSVAAAALSFALVAPLAQPVAFAQNAASGEVTTVDGETAVCGLDPSDPKAKYVTELQNVDGAVEADAIANGYVDSFTDMTNAKNTLSGWVGTAGYGDLTPQNYGQKRGINDVEVYMQWKDKDGVISPVFKTKTHDIITGGAYSFDLREPFYDSNGNEHKFDASNGQSIRVWVKPQVEKRSGMLMYPVRSTMTGLPGEWTTVSGKLGATRFAGYNVQQLQIWMGFLPIKADTGENFMVADEVVENPVPGFSKHTTNGEQFSGRVWLEAFDGADAGNVVTGPTWKAPASSGDAPAVGYKVYMTRVTEEGKKALANAMKQNNQDKPGMVAELIQQNEAAHKADPANVASWLHKTWVATTGEDGRYSLDMTGDYGYTDIYMWVEDPTGTVVQTHSAFNQFEFASNVMLNASNWVPLSTPAALVGSMNSVNFAVTGSPQRNNLGLYIKEFNNFEHLAHRGDKASVVVDGALPLTANRIVWTNAAGEVIDPATGEVVEGADPKDPAVGTPIEQCGDEAKATLTVPESAKDGDTFVATFYAGPSAVATDSFSVTADTAAEVDPRYGDVFFDEDPETDGYQSLPPKFFKEDRDGVKVDKENDVTDSVEVEEYELAPKFRLPLKDENGEPVMEQARNVDGSPMFEMEPELDDNGQPVVDENGNPKEKQKLDDAGNPIPVMEQKIGVPEGFAIDPATGVVTIPENYLPKDGEDPVTVPVRVTYADGSVDVTDVTFHPTKAYKDVFEPSYDTKLVDPAKDPVVSEPKFTKNGESFDNVPAGSKFEKKNKDGSDWTDPEGYTVTVDPNTGDVTVKADPEKIKELGEDGKPVAPEEFDVPVKVTYPDGTVDDATAKFQLDTDGDGEPDVTDEDDDNDGIPDSDDKNPRDPEVGNDSYVYEPKYDQDGKGKPDEVVTVPAPKFTDKDGKDTKAPEGTKFTPDADKAPKYTDKDGNEKPLPKDAVTVDENTGAIKVTVPEDAKPDTKITVPVVVTYPDDTTDTVDVPVTVEQPDAPA